MSVLSANDSSMGFNLVDYSKEENFFNNTQTINSILHFKDKKTKNKKKFLVNEAFPLKKQGKWSKEEDDILSQLVPKYEGKNWKKVSEQIQGRSPIQCLHRWTKILQPGLVKGPWTVEEDKKLMEWVKTEGATKWSQCSDFIKGRNGKQCRERWFNTLNPEVKKGNWTYEEDYKIFFLFTSLGGKWSKITNLLIGRTENSIKNRFYSTLRRLSAEEKKRENIFKEFSIASQSLEDLLKYLETAILEVTFNFCQSKKYTNEDLQKYNSNLIYKAHENLYVSRKKCDKDLSRLVKPVLKVPEFNYSTSDDNINNYQNFENNELPLNNNNNNNFDNEDNKNKANLDYKKMDIFSLERDIMNFCDDSSLFYGNSNNMIDDHVDNIIRDMFSRNDIQNYNEDDKDCNFCCFKENKTQNFDNNSSNDSSTVDGVNKKETFNTLLAQLNDLETTIHNAKIELLKKGADDCSENLEFLTNNLNSVDNLFKF